MNTPLTLNCPANIHILLHYHVSCEPLRQAPVTDECTQMLLEVGAIRPDVNQINASGYTTTPLGAAWVQALCNVPMPTLAYLDEQGRVLGKVNPP